MPPGYSTALTAMQRGPGQGFGTRMMNAMVGQLHGALDYQDNDPGLRVVLTAPLGFEADA